MHYRYRGSTVHSVPSRRHYREILPIPTVITAVLPHSPLPCHSLVPMSGFHDWKKQSEIRWFMILGLKDLSSWWDMKLWLQCDLLKAHTQKYTKLRYFRTPSPRHLTSTKFYTWGRLTDIFLDFGYRKNRLKKCGSSRGRNFSLHNVKAHRAYNSLLLPHKLWLDNSLVTKSRDNYQIYQYTYPLISIYHICTSDSFTTYGAIQMCFDWLITQKCAPKLQQRLISFWN